MYLNGFVDGALSAVCAITILTLIAMIVFTIEEYKKGGDDIG